MTSADVLCLGEAMVQVSPIDGGPLAHASAGTMSLGGAEANVASSLARLGRRTAWASYLGADPLGDLLVTHLLTAGVDVSLVERRADAPTAVYFKDPSPDGTRPLYYRSGSAASLMSAGTAARWATLVSPRLVHVSGITALISASAADFARAVVAERAFGQAVVSFDVNMRASLAGPEAPELLLSLARAADIVFVGRDEAEALWGTRTAADVRALVAGPGIVVVKDGDREAVGFDGDAATAVPALPVEVVEPTGAGDAFAAGWIDSWLAEGSMTAALAAGHRLAALALTTHSDVPALDPRPEDARG